jgi:hypothetical protein
MGGSVISNATPSSAMPHDSSGRHMQSKHCGFASPLDGRISMALSSSLPRSAARKPRCHTRAAVELRNYQRRPDVERGKPQKWPFTGTTHCGDQSFVLFVFALTWTILRFYIFKNSTKSRLDLPSYDDMPFWAPQMFGYCCPATPKKGCHAGLQARPRNTAPPNPRALVSRGVARNSRSCVGVAIWPCTSPESLSSPRAIPSWVLGHGGIFLFSCRATGMGNFIRSWGR